MYADDHQLFSVAKSSNEAERILTREGTNISEWYNNNLLQGNLSKYQVMSLGPRDCQKDLHIVIGDAEIDQKSDNSVRSYIRRPANILEPYKQGLQKSLMPNGCPLEIT